LIGIAKTAKVYPRSEGRAPRSHTAPRNPPDFFCFTTEALKIAADVIISSPLPDNEKGAALLVMVPTKAALSQLCRDPGMQSTAGKAAVLAAQSRELISLLGCEAMAHRVAARDLFTGCRPR
jgi:hypothetical protein